MPFIVFVHFVMSLGIPVLHGDVKRPQVVLSCKVKHGDAKRKKVRFVE